MKKNLIAVLVVATAAVAVEGAATPADDAIKQVFVQLDRCLADSDAKCVGELFVDDATFAAPIGGAKIIKGKAQIVKVLEESLSEMKGAKRTHTVENVRMIGEDHALVDSSIVVGEAKPAQDDAAGPREFHQYHDVAVMVREDGTWLCQDIRSYVVEPALAAKKGSAPAAKQEPAPAAKQEPAPQEE